MSVRQLGPAILAASVAVLIAAGGGAATVSLRPAPGTPDPKLMVLRAPDLHAHVKRQRYFRDTDFPSTIAYERAFREGRAGSTKLLYVDSLAEVGANAVLATRYVAVIRQLASGPGDFTLTKKFLREIGETDVVNSTLKVGHIVNLHAGESSLDIPLSATIRGRRTDLHIALFHVERLIAALAVVGAPGSHVSLAVVTRLARLAAARMVAELAPKNVAPPVVSGSPHVGETLTSSSGLWNGNPTRLSYHWQRCNASGAGCAAIAGVVGQTYALTQADAGSRIRVFATARNRYGATSVQSAPTAAVGAVAAPTNTELPTITGTAQVGQTLSATTGTWTGSPTSFGFQWQRCDAAGSACVAIPGATAGTYVAAASDSGSTLRVSVTATNPAGSATATSGQTAAVP
jgi:hypothetical protein